MGDYLAMLTYSIRLDFADGTYDVVAVSAASIAEAYALLGTVEGCVSTTLLGSVDHAPQACLVAA